MKVCWLTTVPAPYTIKLFNEVGKIVDLYVVLNDVSEANRNSEWVVDGDNSFKLYRIGSGFRSMIRDLAKKCDILINGFYLSKYGYIARKQFHKAGKLTVMAADGGIPKDRGFIINGIMSYLMTGHDYFLSSSRYTNRYFEFYKVNPDKIHLYRFTSLTKEDIERNRKLAEKKNDYRKKLGIDDKFTLISVGQPIKRKGFDILLNSYIKSGLSDRINLYIVGGDPQDETRKIVEDNGLTNVHFIGLIKSDELSEYYATSDAFILTTREDIWGLVIEEAMSYGLPVITSDNCVAGLHFADLGNNTQICGVYDEEGYAKQIRNLYEQQENIAKINKEALDVIEEYSIENSAKDIINALDKML